MISSANDCSFAMAAETVLLPILSRLGHDCPFTVVSFGSLAEFHKNCMHNPKSLCAQIKACSSTWKGRAPVVDPIMYESE